MRPLDNRRLAEFWAFANQRLSELYAVTRQDEKPECYRRDSLLSLSLYYSHLQTQARFTALSERLAKSKLSSDIRVYIHAGQGRLAERWLIGCKDFQMAAASFSAAPIVALAVRGAPGSEGPAGFVESTALNVRFGEGFRANFK